MLKKSLCVFLSLLMLLMMFPVNVFAADVQQTLPINNGMETTAGITGLSSGSTSLTQDRVSGNYAVKVSVGDVPNQTSAAYTLASSSLFDVSKYSQIKLWVKPGPGAQWIQFLTNSVTIKNDKNADGIFKVGEDLISGQWNEVTLDLTKTSSTITQAQSLTVSTNEYSTWTYDDIKTVYSPVSTVDISKMVNAQTQLTNGGVQFKSNGIGGYNTTPTVLVSQNQNVPQATFSRSSVAYKSDGTQVASGAPRFQNGGVLIEEGTTNCLNSSDFEAGWSSYVQNTATGIITYRNDPLYGKVMKIKKTDGSSNRYGKNCGITGMSGSKYSHSIWVRPLTTTGRLSWYIDAANTSGGVITSAIFKNLSDLPLNQWTRLELTRDGGVDTLGGTGGTYIWLDSANGECEFAMPQVELKPYTTSWIPAQTARSAETLTVPITDISPTQGTWEQLVYINSVARTGIPGTRWPGIFTIRRAGDFSSGIICYHKDSSAHWTLLTYNDAGITTAINVPDSYTPDGWHRFGVTWTSTVAKIFIDGVLRGTINNPNLPSSLGTVAFIGSNGNYSHINNPVKDVIISNIARSDAEMQSRGSTSPLPVDERTTLKMNLDGNLGIGTGDITPTIPDGKISKISIDSTYVTSAGTATNLQPQKTYLSGVQPTVLAMSGDGSKVFYANPSDGSRLYLLNLYNGENKKISDYLPTEIKVNFDGTKAAFKDINNTLYLSSVFYDASTGMVSTFSTTHINNSVMDFEVKNNGSICYYETYSGTNTINYPDGGLVNYYSSASHIDISKNGNEIYFTNSTKKLYKLSSTPAGWRSEELVSTGTDITGVWTNSDGSLVFYSTNGGIYCYQVSSKALRKLDIPVVVSDFYPNKQIVKVTDDNKLIIQLENYKYQVYDIDTDTSKDIRPSDAINPPNAQTVYFAADNSGNKMAYVANGGLATYYINGVTRPERYLLSFDGKNSWQSYRDGAWTTVKTGSTPTTNDFSKYGMTIDEVNSLNGSDFEKLYENGRQIVHFDIAVYFASVDAFTTPSLNGIKVYFNTGDSQNGETQIEKSLYTTKQQDFTASKWRKIKKIHPVEVFPKDAEIYYFILKDGQYKTYKNNQWSNVSSSLFPNVENSWIDSSNGQGITQLGMTAEELRAIPQTSLSTLLPVTNLSIVYAMKVDDISTDGYSSMINVDYEENLFTANNLVLKITLTDGTVKEYSGLTKNDVEDFMSWLNERQYGRGPVFYLIKTPGTSTGVVQTNKFVNYYMIQNVDVDEMQ